VQENKLQEYKQRADRQMHARRNQGIQQSNHAVVAIFGK
jgi:hypothetical protein